MATNNQHKKPKLYEELFKQKLKTTESMNDSEIGSYS